MFQDETEKPQRESWMTELPPELQHVGLEARGFKKRSGPEDKDRSMWTDTPGERERKARVSLFHCTEFYFLCSPGGGVGGGWGCANFCTEIVLAV